MLDLIVARLGLPLMVKPATGGSALGVQKVSRVEDLPAAMVSCFAYGDTVLVERFVEGVEVAVSVIDLGDGPEALPGGRDRAGVRRLRLHRPLHPGLTEYHSPGPGLATTSPPRRRRWPSGCTEVLGLADLSRTDAIVDAGRRRCTSSR